MIDVANPCLVLVDDDIEDAVMLRTAAARTTQDIDIVHLMAGKISFMQWPRRPYQSAAWCCWTSICRK